MAGRQADEHLTLFRQIENRKTSDIIIEQIQALIAAGQLRPGMKLPSERALADRFQVGRGPVRDALKKLEFYGVVRTESQRGTYVAEIGEKTLQGLISSLLRGGNHDIDALFETREILEVHAAAIAADRATQPELEAVQAAHDEFERAILSGSLALDEDHLFHLAVGRAAKNPVLASLLGYLTPEIIKTNRAHSNAEIVDQSSRRETLEEHRRIVDALVARDSAAAEGAMADHMAGARERRFRRTGATPE